MWNFGTPTGELSQVGYHSHVMHIANSRENVSFVLL